LGKYQIEVSQLKRKYELSYTEFGRNNLSGEFKTRWSSLKYRIYSFTDKTHCTHRG